MVRELVGAHFGLGASLQDIQKLPAETFQLGKANPVEGDEHQLGQSRAGRQEGEGAVGAPGPQEQEDKSTLVMMWRQACRSEGPLRKVR